MEPGQKAVSPQKNTDEDVDLGQLFYKTGGAINNVMTRTGRAFSRLAAGILQIIFFFRRNLLWLALGTALGLAYGFYVLQKHGTKYSSAMTIRANFNSTRALYGTMDFFNAMINAGQYNELAKLLTITPAQAEHLTYFDATPVESEIITADMYREQFLRFEKADKPRTDTFWMNTITYKNFKNSLTKFDYPLHEIKVISTDPTLYPKIQQGVLDKISSNRLLQQIRDSGIATNRQIVGLIQQSIQSLDTLKASYNKRLAATGTGKELPSSNVLMLDAVKGIKTPELEVYDKMLELKEELKTAKTESVLESDIVQVYSPFNSIGQKENIFSQSIPKYALIGFLATLLVLSLIGLNSFLKALEKRRTTKSD